MPSSSAWRVYGFQPRSVTLRIKCMACPDYESADREAIQQRCPKRFFNERVHGRWTSCCCCCCCCGCCCPPPPPPPPSLHSLLANDCRPIAITVPPNGISSTSPVDPFFVQKNLAQQNCQQKTTAILYHSIIEAYFAYFSVRQRYSYWVGVKDLVSLTKQQPLRVSGWHAGTTPTRE